MELTCADCSAHNGVTCENVKGRFYALSYCKPTNCACPLIERVK